MSEAKVLSGDDLELFKQTNKAMRNAGDTSPHAVLVERLLATIDAVTAERDELSKKNLHLIAENAALKAEKLCKGIKATKPGNLTGKIIAEKVWRG